MRQIVYFSTAAGRQDAATMAAIRAVSHEHNRREKLTGLLVAGGQRYLHVIEGPPNKVDALVERIRHDERHIGLTVLVERKIRKRSFTSWSASYFEKPQSGHYATLWELIDHMRALVHEQKLRDQLDCFAHRFAVAPVAPVALPWTLATSYGGALPLYRRH